MDSSFHKQQNKAKTIRNESETGDGGEEDCDEDDEGSGDVCNNVSLVPVPLLTRPHPVVFLWILAPYISCAKQLQTVFKNIDTWAAFAGRNYAVRVDSIERLGGVSGRKDASSKTWIDDEASEKKVHVYKSWDFPQCERGGYKSPEEIILYQ